MTHAAQMLRSHPGKPQVKIDAVAACIDACFDCAETCAACADACLSEERVAELVHCIRLDLHCGEVCEVTGKLLARVEEPITGLFLSQLQATFAAVRACAEECERHAGMHDHCRVCAHACRVCQRACDDLMRALPPRA